jgi:preprotein translocase subunit YajC
MWLEGIAWAQQRAPAGASSPSFSDQLIATLPMLAIVLVVFYFLLYRPQAQKAQEHTKMLSNLKRNDEVVTQGGLIGRIVELGEKVVTLEIAPSVRVRVERPQIASLSAYGKTPSKGGKDKGD